MLLPNAALGRNGRSAGPFKVFCSHPFLIQANFGRSIRFGPAWKEVWLGFVSPNPFWPGMNPHPLPSGNNPTCRGELELSRATAGGTTARRGARGGDGNRSRPSSTLSVAFSPVTHRRPSSFLPSSLPDARVLARILFCLTAPRSARS
jgi:hypothetical protein